MAIEKIPQRGVWGKGEGECAFCSEKCANNFTFSSEPFERGWWKLGYDTMPPDERAEWAGVECENCGEQIENESNTESEAK